MNEVVFSPAASDAGTAGSVAMDGAVDGAVASDGMASLEVAAAGVADVAGAAFGTLRTIASGGLAAKVNGRAALSAPAAPAVPTMPAVPAASAAVPRDMPGVAPSGCVEYDFAVRVATAGRGAEAVCWL